MKDGYHIEVGVVDEVLECKKWTYYAKFVEDETGSIKAQVTGLKRTKLKEWIKQFK